MAKSRSDSQRGREGEVKIAVEGFSAYAFFDPSPISSKESKTFPYFLPKFHMSYASVLQPQHFWFESIPWTYYEEVHILHYGLDALAPVLFNTRLR